MFIWAFCVNFCFLNKKFAQNQKYSKLLKNFNFERKFAQIQHIHICLKYNLRKKTVFILFVIYIFFSLNLHIYIYIYKYIIVIAYFKNKSKQKNN